MAKLDSFSGLTKPQEDLLSKHYCFGSLALLNLNLTRDNFTFHTRVSERASEHPRASAWLQFKNDLFLLKGKRRNDRLTNYKLEFTPEKLLPNFKAAFEYKLDGHNEDEGTLSFEYTHEKARGKVSFLTTSQILRLQGTAGKPESGFGLDAKLSTETMTLTNHIQAFYYFKNNSRLVLKHLGRDLKGIGQLEVSYLHVVSNLANISSKVTADWATRTTYLEVGGDYQYDPKSWVKGKINSEGRIGLALTRLVADNLRASVATDFSAKSLFASHGNAYNLGFRFDFSS